MWTPPLYTQQGSFKYWRFSQLLIDKIYQHYVRHIHLSFEKVVTTCCMPQILLKSKDNILTRNIITFGKIHFCSEKKLHLNAPTYINMTNWLSVQFFNPNELLLNKKWRSHLIKTVSYIFVEQRLFLNVQFFYPEELLLIQSVKVTNWLILDQIFLFKNDHTLCSIFQSKWLEKKKKESGEVTWLIPIKYYCWMTTLIYFQLKQK